MSTLITRLPDPPTRNTATDAQVFAEQADAFLGALPNFGAQANDLAAEVEEKAQSAAASLVGAIGGATAYATSETSLEVKTGSVTLTLSLADRKYGKGQSVTIASTASPSANAMWGQVTDFTVGESSLTVDVTHIKGHGTFNAWTVTPSLSFDPAAATQSIDLLIDGKSPGNSVYLGTNAGTTHSGGNNRNVGVGIDVLTNVTSGEANTALGYQSLKTSYNGSFNVAVGMNALCKLGESQQAASQTSDNVAVGANCLYSSTSGIKNTAVGSLAGRDTTDGDNNIFVGYSAGYKNTSGSNNVYVGMYAGNLGTTVNYNTAVGYQALRDNQTSTRLTAVGSGALAMSTANDNTAVGYYAGTFTNSGTQNTFVGSKSSENNNSGDSNVTVGHNTHSNNFSGNQNVIIGASAGATNNSADNVIIGYNTASNLTSGSQCIIIGSQLNAPLDTGDGQINIGNAIFGVNATYIGSSINHAMKVGIGTRAPQARFDCESHSTLQAGRFFRPTSMVVGKVLTIDSGSLNEPTTKVSFYSDGDISTTGNFTHPSDIKLKQDITDATPKLADLMKVKIRRFALKDIPEFYQIGVIAQELEDVFPTMVDDRPDMEMAPDLDWEPSPAKYEHRPITEVVPTTVSESTVVYEGGKYVQKKSESVVHRNEPTYTEHPLYGEDGKVVGTHRVMQTEPVLISEAETEADRPMIEKSSGTHTKSVKYMVFIPIIIKAMQEQQEIINALAARVASLEAG